MIYVVGSGPAGVSCAIALIRNGLSVTMIDAGLELEPERLGVVQKLRSSRPGDWDETSLNSIRDNMSSSIAGIPVKYVYGSDFPYRETNKYIPIEARGVETSPSLAKGGFSNVWGAGVLPYSDDDMTGWPISPADLVAHYKCVLSFTGLAAGEDHSGVKDDFERIMPLGVSSQALRPSRQALALMEDLRRHKNVLRGSGFAFGYSRLALRSQPAPGSPGCLYCGLCMYGCPYGLIYSSSSTLTELQTASNFTYIKDVIVDKLIESNGRVCILARSRLGDEPLSFVGSRVYVASGVISTTKILLESLEAYERPLLMKDSQYFMFPMVRYKNAPDVTSEELYTLSQMFIKIVDPDLSRNGIHLSLYTYNDLFAGYFSRVLGPAYRILRRPINELLGRLLVIGGDLHSDISSTISTRLVCDKANSRRVLVLEGRANRRTKQVINGILGKLFNNREYFKAIPVSPLLQIARPGRGFHSGGTFPMRKNPSDFETDSLGRPYGFRNIHVVDATIFPTIPAGPITLTVMANAHRIASEC